jgi:NAD(P)-dependent dehydrogenase (short-subunit alcohol dehydrogenase family)
MAKRLPGQRRGGRRGAWAAALGAGLAARWAIRSWRARREHLDGQVVLITGGSRGLGLLLARQFARERCRIVICARDPGELERARAKLETRGVEVLALTCDVTDRAQVEGLVDETIRQFGRLDVLVNNAGVIQVGPLSAMTVVDFHYAMAVNFWGTVHATLASLPSLTVRGGRIVNVTSFGGKVAVPHLLPYDCAKFAALGFSEGLRAELGRDGVSVTTVVPGLMRTGSYLNALFKGKQESEFDWFSFAARNPLAAMDAEHAARRIVRAAKLRDPEVVLGWQAKLLGFAKDLFPGPVTRLLGVVNRLLPRPEGGETIVVPGRTLAAARALREG